MNLMNSMQQRCGGASTSGRASSGKPHPLRRRCCSAAAPAIKPPLRRCGSVTVAASSSAPPSSSSSAGPNLLQRLGRVLREKAAGDLERFSAGTAKTRERLGVRLGRGGGCGLEMVCVYVAFACVLSAAHCKRSQRSTAYPPLNPTRQPLLTPPKTTKNQPKQTQQLVEELLTFWSLEDYEQTLEELEEVLIVSLSAIGWGGGVLGWVGEAKGG
jgi:hypothetical protein